MFIYLSIDLILCLPNSAGVELRKIIKKIRDGGFKCDGREPAEINWTQYDQAQIYEMANYLDNIRNLVDESDRRVKERTRSRKREPGRPSVDPADIAKILLLQTYTESSNRVAEGLSFLFR